MTFLAPPNDGTVVIKASSTPKRRVGNAAAQLNFARRTIKGGAVQPGSMLIVNGTTSRQETTGTGNHTAITAFNAALLADPEYGPRVVDAFGLFCTNNGAPDDQWLGYSGGVIGANEVHWNDWANYKLAELILAKRVARGN